MTANKAEELAGASFFQLVSDELEVVVSNWGARLISVKQGGQELLYGPKNGAELAEDTCYCGAVCGRVANRIAGGTFSLDGKDYRLVTNSGPNHLHGGVCGFDSRLWVVQEACRERLCLRLLAADGEEGYPGAVEVSARYELRGNTLVLGLYAAADAHTLLNLTNHAYWNLAGGGDVDAHRLRVAAEYYTPTAAGIPTGEICSVEGTPYDLRRAQLLGAAAAEIGAGYDENFVLSQGVGISLREAAQLRAAGRRLTLSTDAPGLQVYTGDYLPHPRGGVALEAQSYPDAPHHPNFPSIELLPGRVWSRRIAWEIT